MRLKVILATSAAVLALSGAAQGYFIPHIHQGDAEQRTAAFLHQSYASWRYRSEGYIDCDNGRLSNVSWACRVGWIRGGTCRQGRVRITNQYLSGNQIYYNIHFIGRRC